MARINDGEQVVIAIDSRLKGLKRVRTEFHEIGHYFLHKGLHTFHNIRLSDIDTLEFNRTPAQDWLECEANIVALIAIAPGFFGVAELAFMSLTASRIDWLRHKR
jgi:Zn-dependent peptidase ImmA (M78 family)